MKTTFLWIALTWSRWYCHVVGFFCIFCLHVLAFSLKAQAQYTFTLIADTSGPFEQFGLHPALNSSGTVAFRAWLDNSTQGIFAGNGTMTTTIAASALPFVGFGDPAINQAGTVAFLESTGGFNNIVGVYAGSGGPLVTIAETTGLFSGFAAGTSVNGAGTIAFSASLKSGGGTGIFTSNGGVPVQVVNGSFSPSINDSETIAFKRSAGVFTASGGLITKIADRTGPLKVFNNEPSINDAGTVAFVAGIGDIDSGAYGIYSGNGGPLTTIADLSGLYSYFDLYSPSSINDSGTVAFFAGLDAGGYGLFLGDGISTIEVIHTGDALFGSTVTGFAISPTSLNDSGQLAFAYGLANGTAGIAIATPVPEPSTALFLALSLGMVFAPRLRRAGRA